MDLTWDEEKRRSVKRKRDEPSVQKGKECSQDEDKRVSAVMKLIRSVEKEVRALGKVVRDNSNTKREIKDITQTLRSMTSRSVSTEMQAMLSTMEKSIVQDIARMESPVEDKACQVSQLVDYGDEIRVRVGNLEKQLKETVEENRKLKREIESLKNRSSKRPSHRVM